MSDIVDSLKKYFKETPEEVIKKDFEEVYNKYGHIGPDVKEYIRFVQENLNKNE